MLLIYMSCDNACLFVNHARVDVFVHSLGVNDALQLKALTQLLPFLLRVDRLALLLGAQSEQTHHTGWLLCRRCWFLVFLEDITIIVLLNNWVFYRLLSFNPLP